MRARVAGPAACAVGLALAGCGTGADQRQARAVAERFYEAVQAHEGSTACALLSEEPPDCADAVLDLHLRGTRADSVSVYATSAQVHFPEGDTVFLGFTRNGWRIQAVGCRTGSGGGPLECEEES
jgi:hypothetical protein